MTASKKRQPLHLFVVSETDSCVDLCYVAASSAMNALRLVAAQTDNPFDEYTPEHGYEDAKITVRLVEKGRCIKWRNEDGEPCESLPGDIIDIEPGAPGVRLWLSTEH